MFKRTIGVLCAAAVAFGTASVLPAEAKILNANGMIFDMDAKEGYAYLKDFDDSASEVFIPTKENGLPVWVGSHAFAESKNLTKVRIGNPAVIEDSVFYKCEALKTVEFVGTQLKEIPRGMFSNCYELEDIGRIPDTVETIGYEAFNWCNKLKDECFVLPEGLTYISKYAFSDCYQLKNLHIPANVNNIGDLAFYKCWYLENITVDPENQHYSAKDNILYEISQAGGESFLNPNTVIKAGCKVKNVVLPEGTKWVDSCAFEYCDELESIAFPSSMRRIRANAFYNCTKLKKVTFSSKVKDMSVGGSTFEKCTSLKSVTIPKGVTEIGEEAFGYIYNGMIFAPDPDFVINCYENSEAHKYAKANDLKFKFPDDLKLGDCDGSKVVNMKDLAMLQRYVNGWDIPEIHLSAADMDNNEKINMKDITALQRKINGFT